MDKGKYHSSRFSPVLVCFLRAIGIADDFPGKKMHDQCCDKHGTEHSNITLNELVQAVKATGSIGVVGVFVKKDPKSKEELQKKGHMDFDFGSFWMKGQRMATGQANVKSYNRQLCNLISLGKAKPSNIISHELSLEDAPDAYKHFDERDKGWTKVILKPGKKSENKNSKKREKVVSL